MSNYQMNVPVQTGSGKEKNKDLQLVPAGPQPAIIYGLVNIGTHEGEYNGQPNVQNKIKILVEFPFHKQLYYKEDTVPTPSSLIVDCKYALSIYKGKKSKFLEIVESLFGPQPKPETFNPGQLVGINVFANIVHYTKNDGTIGAKISSFGQSNPSFVDPSLMVRTNQLYCYDVQSGFDNKNFAELPFYLRRLTKESKEGKEYTAKGGRFTKLDENGNVIIDSGDDDYASASPLGKIVMLNNQYTYEQMRASGWSDDALIEHGYAKRETPKPATPAPAPMPTAPSIPQPMAPQIPMPVAAPAPSQPILVMLDKSATYEQYKASGWTDELLIQHGKATMMPAQNAVFPPQPVAPAIPSAPAPIPNAAAAFAAAPIPVQPAMPVMPQAPQGFAATPYPPMSNNLAPTSFTDDEAVDDLPF
jgi:hypothetical protein